MVIPCAALLFCAVFTTMSSLVTQYSTCTLPLHLFYHGRHVIIRGIQRIVWQQTSQPNLHVHPRNSGSKLTFISIQLTHGNWGIAWLGILSIDQCIFGVQHHVYVDGWVDYVRRIFSEFRRLLCYRRVDFWNTRDFSVLKRLVASTFSEFRRLLTSEIYSGGITEISQIPKFHYVVVSRI